MAEVLRHLQTSESVVLWGGLGEGKSALAMSAGCALYDLDMVKGGAFCTDLAGTVAPVLPHSAFAKQCKTLLDSEQNAGASMIKVAHILRCHQV